MVGRSSLRSGSGRESLPEVREWSEGPSRRSGSDREAHPKFQKWSGDSPEGPGVVGSGRWGPSEGPGVVGEASRRYGSGSGALPEVLEWNEGPFEV